MAKVLRTENDVKDVVKAWYDKRLAWHYAPIQNGMGVVGIHDRIGCLPVLVTPEMVGKTIGLFVSVEAKAPGRRGEARRGMSVNQERHMKAIRQAHGISIVCDGHEDLHLLNEELDRLVGK